MAAIFPLESHSESGGGEVDIDKLSECQKIGQSGIFAQSLSAFLQWLAPRYDEVQKSLKREEEELRLKAGVESRYRRTADIVSKLAVGLRYYLRFAVDVKLLPSEEAANKLWQTGWNALNETGRAQSIQQETVNPAHRFLELTTSAITSGEAHVDGKDGNTPDNPVIWGWHKKTIGTRSGGHEDWQAQGTRIGWVVGEDLYLEPEACDRIARSMAERGGSGIAISAHVLRKRLHEQGLLRTTEQEVRGTYTIRRNLAGARRKVLHLNSSLVMSPETDQTDHPDPTPLKQREFDPEQAISWSDTGSERSRIRPLETDHDRGPSEGGDV